MRILMINHEFTVTGSSTAFFRLAKHLQSSGHHITILPINPAPGPIADHYAAAGIPIETNVGLRNFSLAIANTICAAPAINAIGRQLPTIWFVNEAEVALGLLRRNPDWAAAFVHASMVIYNSAFQHDVFRSFTYPLDPAKFHTVPFGVDIDASRIRRDRAAPKAGRIRIVQVGTIEPRKRPGDVIRAVARLDPQVECVICGKIYNLEPEAQAIANADPARYRLLEGLSDEEVLAWVESADVFVLASESETQALAAYEAALLARPMILSDLPCYRGVFAHGRNCLMFPPGHVEMLAQSIGMLMRSSEMSETLGRAAQRVAGRYTNQAFFERFGLVMQQALGPR